MEITTVGVVGCGVMGAGIVQVCAQAGYSTIVSEQNQETLQRGLASIKRGLDRQVQRGNLSQQERDTVMGRIRETTDTKDFSACQLVVESIVEDLERKKQVFNALDAICSPDAILATNSSSLSIIEMAAVTKRPERVLGIHFFNPPPVMRLVELVRTISSSDETMDEAKAFAESLGKTVILAPDTPGYVVNYLLVPYLLDAIRLFSRGVATREDVDQGMVLGCNMPMGPLALADLIGLDTLLYIADSIYDEVKDNKFAAPAMLRRFVAAGRLGRKAGQGFHDYPRS